ncbi:histidine phosphatase family protein [Uliginosibacterium sp. H1]|uniref:histidine phosphatase family protein n=1 Tax=Uliginosibacterium sp. H1 TaxID=3114757 RepID=UPI002E1738A0|nr:histidine phosphatase family protein [Uliginosibacterium sp. H1]
MKLYLARHGQTALNREQRFQGSLDAPLDDTGIAQAVLLAEKLPTDISRIVSSPLLRARQTAESVAALRGLPVHLVEEFRERHYGVFEGLNRQELETRHAELWQRGIVRLWDEAPPGGETMRAVRSRVEQGLLRLHREHAGETVLLVAHGFVARMVHFLLHDLPEADIHQCTMLGNAEFGVYELPQQAQDALRDEHSRPGRDTA